MVQTKKKSHMNKVMTFVLIYKILIFLKMKFANSLQNHPNP